MPKPALSFIVPFYNVEKYIGLCLESIYNQDISEDLFEVICIDDRSPDNSVDLVKKFQKKHKNLILIEHDVNKCLGGARNTGIDAAKGKYIWFIDSDDKIAPNVLMRLVDLCENDELDILMFNARRFTDQDTYLGDISVFIDSKTQTGLGFIHQYFGTSIIYHLGYVWRQIYRRNFIINNALKFPEHTFWEDTAFMPESLIKATKVRSIEEPVYHYRVNLESVSGIFDRQHRADLIYQFAFNAGKDLYALSQKTKTIDSELSNAFHKQSLSYINKFSYTLLKAPLKERIAFFKHIRNNSQTLKELLPLLNKSNRLLVRFPYLGMILYLLLYFPYRIKQMFK